MSHDRPQGTSAPTGDTVQVVRTYLTMDAPTDLRMPPVAALALDVTRSAHCTASEYRRLYRDVGAAWHWHDREQWSDAELAAYLASDGVDVWVARLGRRLAGYFELRVDGDGGVEIVYFGLTRAFMGQGLGGVLLARAVEEAWRLGARRVWLHTCTLDAPQALPNYIARGFRVERTETYETVLPQQA